MTFNGCPAHQAGGTRATATSECICAQPQTEKAQQSLRILSTTTTYALRDFMGEVVPMPGWRTDADVAAAMERHKFQPSEVVVLTTTVTEQPWEAAS